MDQCIAEVVKFLATLYYSLTITFFFKLFARLLMGHRPFWWVREVLEELQPLRAPKLRQTPLTCETGPGNPSGHVMSYASICLLLVFAINEFTKRRW
jgi:glucose-6-phosphatase